MSENRKGKATSVPNTVLLVNIIAPYRMPVLRILAEQLKALTVLVSTPMEANRSWQVDWEGLRVVVQRNFTITRTARHPSGFSEASYVHVPYDTLVQLLFRRPKVVISGELGLRSVQAALYRMLAPHSRLILHADLSERTELGRGRERFRAWILKKADAVLVNGVSGKRYINALGVPDAKIHTVPYTTDVSAFLVCAPKYREPGERHLLFVGQLIERKGILPFITTLCDWGNAHSDQKVYFKLVGSGPLEAEIGARKTPGNVTVRLLGEVPHEQLSPLYADADLFVLPSLAETWGLVINEAMAAGLPVLGSRYCQAVEELVSADETGWLFFPDQAESMAEALDQALSAPADKLTKMGAKSREAVAHLTPAFVAALMMDAIRDVW